jgi:hypothetical protein
MRRFANGQIWEARDGSLLEVEKVKGRKGRYRVWAIAGPQFSCRPRYYDVSQVPASWTQVELTVWP